MINNRQQNGRRRGRGSNGNGGGGQRNGNPGRPDSGNRIDNRARGNANQLFEKYRNLARDAQMSGDRVNTEYYLQFADHYFRVLSESRSRFEDQNQQAPRRQSNDSFDAFDSDDDYGDEGEPIRAGEQAGDDTRNRPEQRDNREVQNTREVRDNREPRDAREPRESREPREPREPYQREPRAIRERDGGDQRDTRDMRDDNDRDTRRNGNAPVRELEERNVPSTAVANDVDAASPEASAPPAEPRRGRRPRRDRVEAPAEEAPAAIEADRLPPSLSAVRASTADEPASDAPMASAPVEAGTDTAGDATVEEQPKPRRRRLRTVNGGEATPAD